MMKWYFNLPDTVESLSIEISDDNLYFMPRVGEHVVLYKLEESGYDTEYEITHITHFPRENKIAFWLEKS
jgi:hypothetical protein